MKVTKNVRVLIKFLLRKYVGRAYCETSSFIKGFRGEPSEILHKSLFKMGGKKKYYPT